MPKLSPLNLLILGWLIYVIWHNWEIRQRPGGPVLRVNCPPGTIPDLLPGQCTPTTRRSDRFD